MNEQLLKKVDDALVRKTSNNSIAIPKFGKFPVADLELIALCARTGAKLNFATPAAIKLLSAIRDDK